MFMKEGREKIMKSRVYNTDLGIHPVGDRIWEKLIRKQMLCSEVGEKQRTLLEGKRWIGEGKSEGK